MDNAGVLDLVDVEQHAGVDDFGVDTVAVLVLQPFGDVVDAGSRDGVATLSLGAGLVRGQVHSGNQKAADGQTQSAVAAIELIAHVGVDDPGRRGAEALGQWRKHLGGSTT